MFLVPGSVIAYLLLNHNIQFKQIEEFIRSYGYISALAFLLIFALRTFLVVAPYYIMVILGGTLFGPVYGLLYNILAVLICSTLAFYLSRNIKTGFLTRFFNLEKQNKYTALIEKHGMKIILLMRLSVVLPFDLVNYAAGLTSIRYRNFIIGNVSGLMPELILLTFFGEHIKNPFTLQFKCISALVLLAVIIFIMCNKTIRGLFDNN